VRNLRCSIFIQAPTTHTYYMQITREYVPSGETWHVFPLYCTV